MDGLKSVGERSLGMKRQMLVLSMALAVAGIGCSKGTDDAEVFQVALLLFFKLFLFGEAFVAMV